MDIYFVVAPEQYANHTILVMPDNDYLPLGSNINSFPLYKDDEKVIVKSRIEEDNLVGWLDETCDCGDQFGPNAVAYVGMVNTYIGTTWESVVAAYPELTTPTYETIDGQLTETTKLKNTLIL